MITSQQSFVKIFCTNGHFLLALLVTTLPRSSASLVPSSPSLARVREYERRDGLMSWQGKLLHRLGEHQETTTRDEMEK
ncbi:hypothetical protein L873DRAFT_1821931 [Choiromyces venosus 120613-1]|uniref:Secreted protein n=1 Tax=Choiromyces venosus 120613-1 TaxID=1336337 RepID=A0A3N4IUU3_9PEZI|nr:hypothetical protein L873DRAFT_1821931 [Choiromyces venosus 120613-1]